MKFKLRYLVFICWGAFVLHTLYSKHSTEEYISQLRNEVSCLEQEHSSVEIVDYTSIMNSTNGELSLKDSVILHMKNIRIKHPEIVLAQAILESGTFTSNVFRNSNNMFGMKYPRVRPTLAVGKYNSYARFDTWQNCIEDYLIYQSLYIPTKSKKEYFAYLGKRYAEDPHYVTKIKRMSEEYMELF